MNNFDSILDYESGEDIISFNGSSTLIDFEYLGNIQNLSYGNINSLLFTNGLQNYEAIGFDVLNTNQTFISINNDQVGFQPSRDILIDITGYTGELDSSIIFA